LVKSLNLKTFSMDTVSRDSVAQMTSEFSNNSSDTDMARCVTYTSDELKKIVEMAAGGNVQFQFAKNEEGQSTLIIAIAKATDDGQPNSFFKAGEICPPPEGCMLT
jgi:hypothetical protein